MGTRITRLERQHSDRFRRVATRYPRRVAEAYEGDIAKQPRIPTSRLPRPFGPGRSERALDRETGGASAEMSETPR